MAQDDQNPGTYELVDARPTAVVIHCSDPRFQKAFADFIAQELHLGPGEYIPLVISGGVGSLAEPLRLPKEFKFIKERIGMFLDRFDTIDRIVLINHEDCRHYESLQEYLGALFLRRLPTLVERQRDDLIRVAKTLPGILKPSLKIEVFYAKFSDPGRTRVVFERL